MVPDRKDRWDTVKTIRILRTSRGFASGLCKRPWNSQELCTYTHSPDTRHEHRRLTAYSRTCYSVTRVHESTWKSGRFNSCICLCTMKVLRRPVDEELYSCYNSMLVHKVDLSLTTMTLLLFDPWRIFHIKDMYTPTRTNLVYGNGGIYTRGLFIPRYTNPVTLQVL
jgi:hypothetical protein